MNILASLLQSGQVTAGQSGPVSSPEQGDVSLSLFGEMVQSATLVSSDTNAGSEGNPGIRLEQQLRDLSIATADQLRGASEQNVSAEGVESILTQAVAQFWSLLEGFDTDNDTQLVATLSNSLMQVAPESDRALMAPNLAQPAVRLSADFGVSQVNMPEHQAGPQTFFLQVFNLLAGFEAGPDGVEPQARQMLPPQAVPANLVGSELLNPPGVLVSGPMSARASTTPILSGLTYNFDGQGVPLSRPNVTSGQVAAASQPAAENVINPQVGRPQESQALAAPSDPKSNLNGDVLPQNRAGLIGGQLAPQAAAVVGTGPVNAQASAIPPQVARGEAAPVNSSPQMNASFSSVTQNLEAAAQIALQTQTPAEKVVAQAVTPLLQQGAAVPSLAIPLKDQASNGKPTDERAVDLTNLAQKSNAAITTFVAGVDVNMKVKELLLASAKAIMSGKDVIAGSSESNGVLSQSRSDLFASNNPARSELASQAGSFSKNITSQIKVESLNMGRTQIELAPRGLGSIVIDLLPKESGGLQVVLRVENPVVLHALRNDREALLSLLSNSGVSQDDISLDFEGFEQSQFRQDAEDQVLPGLENEAEIDPEDMDKAALAITRPVGPGQLDIFT